MYIQSSAFVSVCDLGTETTKHGDTSSLQPYSITKTPPFLTHSHVTDLPLLLSSLPTTDSVIMPLSTHIIPLRHRILDTLIETGTSSCLFMDACVADLFSFGKGTGVVVKLGESVCVSSVCDGMRRVVRERCFGGKDMTKMFCEMLVGVDDGEYVVFGEGLCDNTYSGSQNRDYIKLNIFEGYNDIKLINKTNVNDSNNKTIIGDSFIGNNNNIADQISKNRNLSDDKLNNNQCNITSDDKIGSNQCNITSDDKFSSNEYNIKNKNELNKNELNNELYKNELNKNELNNNTVYINNTSSTTNKTNEYINTKKTKEIKIYEKITNNITYDQIRIMKEEVLSIKDTSLITYKINQNIFHIKNLRYDPIKELLKGIKEMIRDVIEGCESEYKNTLLNNIVLTGGCAGIQDIAEKIAGEVSEIYPPSKVRVSYEGNFHTFMGAAVFGSLGSTKCLFIGKKDYEEFGNGIVERKSFLFNTPK